MRFPPEGVSCASRAFARCPLWGWELLCRGCCHVCMFLSSGGILGRMLSRVGTSRVLNLGHILVNLSSCVALNRFRGLESVAVLEAAARELMRKNSFLASKCPVAAVLPGPCVCLTWLREKGIPSTQSRVGQTHRTGRWEEGLTPRWLPPSSAQCCSPCLLLGCRVVLWFSPPGRVMCFLAQGPPALQHSAVPPRGEWEEGLGPSAPSAHCWLVSEKDTCPPAHSDACLCPHVSDCRHSALLVGWGHRPQDCVS